eukprot:CAMPEP_0198287542 /NCGR_PEP_ID=MMETSP1449-20131203/6308_1 /TAXON_ID=420275 /ORGANISM="Attheya septentrionalis, Strain CCMP2084" /LENGTH=159 /DNA_ID=CAMNT_0043985503 /DNA_START=215 /DNA_END=694 /DNA_ORIENTATION=-
MASSGMMHVVALLTLLCLGALLPAIAFVGPNKRRTISLQLDKTLPSSCAFLGVTNDAYKKCRPTFGTCSIQPLHASEEPEEDPISVVVEEEEEEDLTVLEKINAVLDRPILDANDWSDQGPIVEPLKKFVRSQPEVASITFSAMVILGLLGAVRFVNSL